MENNVLLKNCKTDQGVKNIHIIDDKINYVGVETPKSLQVLDMNGFLIIPGMIDPHVHLRDMEQIEKEDWLTGSKAAINGGVTFVFDMPNTIPATICCRALERKQRAAHKSLINEKFYLGSNGENLYYIEKMLDQNFSEIAGIKIFLAASSSNEVMNYKYLDELLKLAKKYDVIVSVHSELKDCIDKYSKLYDHNILNHNMLRNKECSIQGTKNIIESSAKIGNKLYICHVSTKEEIEIIKQYKQDYPVYCEITPHHLLLNEEILKIVGNIGKVNPPLRTKTDNEALWQAIDDNIVDTIGSDHAPHKLSEKNLEYDKAPSGFPGLETSLHLLINEMQKGNISLEKLIQLTSTNAAKIFKIQNRGELKTGYFADLAVIDLDKSWKIDSSKFQTKAKYSPFDGFEMKGKVVKTFVGGKMFEINTIH